MCILLLGGRGKRDRMHRGCWLRESSSIAAIFTRIETDSFSRRASFDATARLWDADKGTCLYTFSRHTDFVYSLGFSPGIGKYLATGSNDGKMCVWDIKVSSVSLRVSSLAGTKSDPSFVGEETRPGVLSRRTYLRGRVAPRRDAVGGVWEDGGCGVRWIRLCVVVRFW